MISKEYLKQINPNKKIYEAKYSEGTYKFLTKYKNKDIRIYWNKRSMVDGSLVEFNPLDVYSTHVYFMYEQNGDLFGTTWTNIMWNKYRVMDYSCWNRNEFEDITDIFLNTYLKIGRCMFDSEHINFMLGQNHSYVSKEERFEIVDDKRKCKWCGKDI
jgi:hypothetical protein